MCMTRTVYTPTHIHTNTVSIYTIGILIGIIIPSESDREGEREKMFVECYGKLLEIVRRVIIITYT